MVFTEFSFFVFLPIVFVLHWLLPQRFRWALLLAASLYFYMSWNVKYIVLILFTTVISFLCGLLLEKAAARWQKKLCIAVCLVASLGVLAVFKYLNWFLDMIGQLAQLIAIPLQTSTLALLLPVGISFYTFQTLSYVIDVYRGDVKAERHLGVYATFVTFFPQLVAGPIERTNSLLPQIKKKRSFDYDQAVYGMILMSWGFFKKVLIADYLAKYADAVFGSVGEKTGFVIVFAVLCFTFQIYCDFSGYSDIAIGTAKLFGIDLCRNFHSPYFARSIKEFWGRWHISLSTWFRDYVYIPCGGNRCSTVKQCRNLMITFLLSGLWHGAGMNFVVWGFLHGFVQCMEKITTLYKKKRKSILHTIVSVFFVFLICNIAWVFFRAETVKDAWWLLSHMLDGIGNPKMYLRSGWQLSNIDGMIGLIRIVLPILILIIYDFISLKHDCVQLLRRQSLVVRWFFYIALTIPWVIVLIASFATESTSSFIYFQF